MLFKLSFKFTLKLIDDVYCASKRNYYCKAYNKLLFTIGNFNLIYPIKNLNKHIISYIINLASFSLSDISNCSVYIFFVHRVIFSAIVMISSAIS
jgi:hypothetical protein